MHAFIYKCDKKKCSYKYNNKEYSIMGSERWSNIWSKYVNIINILFILNVQFQIYKNKINVYIFIYINIVMKYRSLLNTVTCNVKFNLILRSNKNKLKRENAITTNEYYWLQHNNT